MSIVSKQVRNQRVSVPVDAVDLVWFRFSVNARPHFFMNDLADEFCGSFCPHLIILLVVVLASVVREASSSLVRVLFLEFLVVLRVGDRTE
ncbi:MAG: hypothetical protein UY85_C0076G0003 [Candidatus Peribacteria bacterium GW2011_GWB1_54_5]|nr:MAG: hypothetical protein UY85_C0076G0003 [Candidatus Peribacteria bacterium GW2011_GWB1_54_5]